MARALYALVLVLVGVAYPVGPAAGSVADDFPSLVDLGEEARGLPFRRPPRLVTVPVGSPALAALREASIPLYDVRGLLGLFPLEHAAADPENALVVADEVASERDVRIALGHLLDAQHHPELVAVARAASGDPGMALRALLAGSALATAQGGLGPRPAEPPVDVLGGEVFTVKEPVAPDAFLGTPLLAAMGFLRSLDDRERAFREPPLATDILIRPSRYGVAPPPLRLEGRAPVPAGCIVAQDESVGVFGLLREAVARGASVPAPPLAGWRGDRIVRWQCLGDEAGFVYVAELAAPATGPALAEAADLLLPPSLPRPFGSAQAGSRVAVFHGLGAIEAQGFATALDARPLRRIEDLVPDAAADQEPSPGMR